MDYKEYSVLQQSIVSLVKNLTSVHNSLDDQKIQKMPDYLIWEILLNRDPNNDLQRIFIECNIDDNKLSKTSNDGDYMSAEETKDLICKKIEKDGKEREDYVASKLVNIKVQRLFQNKDIINLKQLLIKLKDKLEKAEDTGWTDLRVFQSIPFFFSLYKYNPESIINFFETSQALKEDFVWFYPRNIFYEEFDHIGDWDFFMNTFRGAGTIVLFDEKIFCDLMKFDYNAIFYNENIIEGSSNSETWKNYFKNITISCSSPLYIKLVLYHLKKPKKNFLNNYKKGEHYNEINSFLKDRNLILKKKENESGFFCKCRIHKKKKFYGTETFPSFSSTQSCKKKKGITSTNNLTRERPQPINKKISNRIPTNTRMLPSTFVPFEYQEESGIYIDPKRNYDEIPNKYHQLYEYQLLKNGLPNHQQRMGGKKTKRKKCKINKKKKKQSTKRQRKKKSIKRRK